MYLPYFGQDVESKKNVVGILAHVWNQLSVFNCQLLTGLDAGGGEGGKRFGQTGSRWRLSFTAGAGRGPIHLSSCTATTDRENEAST